jgi:LysR family glycine cleavage system transcriptional activator
MATTPLPPLNWLRAFEAAARHLSFTQAATELHMTQSAVSQHIRSLEQHLGRALFIRRTRALMLTEAGHAYLPVVQEAFDVLASGTRSFVGSDRGRSLRLQCNLGFSVFWLTPRLSDLLTQYPWLTLDIQTPIWDPQRTASSAEIEVRFERASAGPPAALRLSHCACYPVASPDFTLGYESWTEAPLFDCVGSMGNWEAWAASQKQAWPKGLQVNLASTYAVSLTAALRGAGLAMAHDLIARDLVADGSLMRPYQHTIPMPEAYFLCPPAAHLETPATRAFTQWISGQLPVA